MSDTSLTVAARRELAITPEVTNLLGRDVTWDTYIFRWRPFVEIEGTGASMIVLSERGGWAQPNRHNTARFPLLQVEVFTDPQRATTGVPKGQPAEAHVTPEDKAGLVFQAVDRVFHVPQGGELAWSDLRIVSSLRNTEPTTVPVPGGDGVVRLLASYAVTVG